jgi:hypothetical protein
VVSHDESFRFPARSALWKFPGPLGPNSLEEISFNQIEEGPFDHRTLEWEHAHETEKVVGELEDLPKLV